MNVRVVRPLLALLLPFLVASVVSSRDARAAQDALESDDSTGLSADAVDPLGWMGENDIDFIARAATDGVDLRSGPDPHYKVVRTVSAGTPLVVVSRVSGFLGVLVPSGFNAFVHSRYVEVDELGIGRVTTSRVNLRSVPSSRDDYPIGQLDAGTVLWVWGPAEGNEQWLEVTAPAELPLWVDPEAVVEDGPADDDRVLSRLLAALDERRAAFDERNAEAVARVQARRDAELERAARFDQVAALRAGLDVERQKGVDADYTATREAVTALEAVDDEQLRAELGPLIARVEVLELDRDRKRDQEALLVRIEDEKRRLAEERAALLSALENVDTTPPIQVGTSGEWSGFVRIRPFAGGTDVKAFALEQGTKVAAWLTSPDGRYRLSDFAGNSMRVRGKIVAQEGERPVVEITRLEQIR